MLATQYVGRLGSAELICQQCARPLVHEAQRHLAQWPLQPIAGLLAEEASEKLSAEVKIDVTRPLQAYDAGGARAMLTIVQALAPAKEPGIAPADLANSLSLVDWE